MAAVEEAVPADGAVGRALYALPLAASSNTFAEKILSAMGKGFGAIKSQPVMHQVSGVAAIVVMGVVGAGKSTVGRLDRHAARLPFRGCG